MPRSITRLSSLTQNCSRCVPMSDLRCQNRNIDTASCLDVMPSVRPSVSVCLLAYHKNTLFYEPIKLVWPANCQPVCEAAITAVFFTADSEGDYAMIKVCVCMCV